MMSKYNQHQILLKQIILAVQKEFPECRLFQQHVGLFFNMRGDKAKLGIPGQADINGIIKINGKGIRLEIEVKSGKGKLGAAQKLWKKMIESMGGIHIVGRSPEQVISEIRERMNR